MHALPILTSGMVLLAIATLASAPGAGIAQRSADTSSIELVEVGVTVVDKKGAPIHGLTKEDFELKEDGEIQPIVTFSEVAEGQDTGVEGRSIVLLLDDAGVPALGTVAVQTIARTIVEYADRHDRLAVVRLSKDGDEAFGDLLDAASRIRDYRGGYQPFLPFVTTEAALARVGAIAQALMADDTGRKILVCIGSPGVCNMAEPQRTTPGRVYEKWVGMVGETARANLSVYAIIPGSYRMRGGGLVDFTGGEFFATSFDIAPAIRRVFQDASNYYLIGYWPDAAEKRRDVHSIKVKVNKQGAKVRVRRQRGN